MRKDRDERRTECKEVSEVERNSSSGAVGGSVGRGTKNSSNWTSCPLSCSPVRNTSEYMPIVSPTISLQTSIHLLIHLVLSSFSSTLTFPLIVAPPPPVVSIPQAFICASTASNSPFKHFHLALKKTILNPSSSSSLTSASSFLFPFPLSTSPRSVEIFLRIPTPLTAPGSFKVLSPSVSSTFPLNPNSALSTPS